MPQNYLIKNAQIINEGKTFESDLLIKNGRIEKIAPDISVKEKITEIDAAGQYLIPGFIDDQVHFREPGLTHKADIQSESRAAVAGGVTSFMEMPNTRPPAITQELLEQKYQRASQVSPANYSFFMGTSNDNYDELMRTDLSKVCGLKIFMGSSTGNMLVDKSETLDNIFANFSGLIATHCEDEQTIKDNTAAYFEKYGENMPIKHHPEIRSAEACYLSSSKAIKLAKNHGTRLHILHISTAIETELFDNSIPLIDKKITTEACTHHLWFTDKDYETKGTLIKWNPAVKSEKDRAAVRAALNDNRIDVLATDHAPHTLAEKKNNYFNAPSGGPLVQHTVSAMFELSEQGVFTKEKIIEKACHNPAILFRIKDRGFIREGYKADLVLVAKDKYTVEKNNILYKCGWSPFEGQEFQYRVQKTFVNGNLVFDQGKIDDDIKGERLLFDNKV